MPLVALRVTEKTATAAYKYPNYETKGSAGTEKCHEICPSRSFQVNKAEIIGGNRCWKSGKPLLSDI
jgi:hypothetical protein